jgi:hypothetical protein
MPRSLFRHQQLIAFRATSPHGAQLPQQPRQFLSPHPDLFRLPSFTFGQHVQLTVLGEQLHFHRFANLLPGQLQPSFLKLLDLRPRRADQVKRLLARRAHFPRHSLGRDSTVHQPHPPSFAIQAFRCGPESRATSSSLKCCRPSLRMPAEAPPVSRSARSPLTTGISYTSACQGISNATSGAGLNLPVAAGLPSRRTVRAQFFQRQADADGKGLDRHPQTRSPLRCASGQQCRLRHES